MILGNRTVAGAGRSETSAASARAFAILHWTYAALPAIAGADKLVHPLGRWQSYVAPEIALALPLRVPTFVEVVGVFEIAIGVVVAFRPKLGAYLLAAWLGAVVLNFVIGMGALDVALRDAVLALGALALARLASDHVPAPSRRQGA